MSEDSNAKGLVPITDNPIAPFSSLSGFVAAQRVAKALASADIVPQAYRENLGNILIAMELATRTKSSILAVMQSVYVVNGKPGWSGAYCIAAANQSGRFAGPLRFEFQGKEGQDDWGCRAVATDRQGERIEGPPVTIRIAKEEGWYNRQGSKWKTMPELMLRYRAATWFVRTEAPELLMGMQTVDEIRDVGPEEHVERKPVTITGLMADAGAQEPGSEAITAGPTPTPPEDKTQATRDQASYSIAGRSLSRMPVGELLGPGRSPPEAPEWPKQDERGRWYDADGVYWDAGAHATPPKSGPPKVNEDGTFRARRGYTHLARDLAEKARQQRAEEPRSDREDAPPAAGDGAGESDGGRSPGPGTTERGGRADGVGSEDQGDPLLTPTSVADAGPPVPGQGPSLQELGDMLAKAKTQDDFDEIESMAQQSLSAEEFSGFNARLVEQWKAWCARY